MKVKLGSNIDKDFKKSSYLDKKQVYLPYDTELFSILKVLAYSSSLNQFAVLFTDVTKRKKYENELKDTIKNFKNQFLKQLKTPKFIFTVRSD
jgi:hypothetical protein